MKRAQRAVRYSLKIGLRRAYPARIHPGHTPPVSADAGRKLTFIWSRAQEYGGGLALLLT